MSTQAPARPEGAAGPGVLRKAEGIELIGELEGSGYKEAPYLARRADGQVIQLTRLLYLVAEAVDGERDLGAVAREVSQRFGRKVSAGNVQFLVERKLRPLGVLAAADGTSPKLRKADPLLGLRFRTAVVPERFTNAVAGVLRPLFWPPVIVAVLAALVALDGWVFFVHGLGGGLRSALYAPAILLFMFGAVVLATGLHELGHATACRYGGATPGVLGAGIYLVWPVFYCDVTDAYRLSRGGRLRTDLGGVYFNGIACLVAGGLYFATGFEPLILLIAVQHLAVIQQLLPLLRLDGYYVVSDLTGVPDILSRLRPILRSLIPGREADPRVTALKPWARAAVSGYVLTLVPVVLLLLVLMTINAPRLFATAYDSMGLQLDRLGDAARDGEPLSVGAGLLQIVALALPCAAIAFSFTRIGRRIATGVAGWASGDALRTTGALAVTLALVGLGAYTWWPNGDYEPIRPGENVTLAGARESLSELPTGRPGFTERRAARFAEVPTQRQVERPEARDGAPGAEPEATPTPTPAAEDEEPTAAPTPDEEPPGATATPEPTATEEPPPEETPAPEPTASPTPAATEAPPTASATPAP